MEIDMLDNSRTMAQKEEQPRSCEVGQSVPKKRMRAQQRQLISLSQEVEVKRKEFEKLDAQHTYLLQRLKASKRAVDVNSDLAPVILACTGICFLPCTRCIC